MTQIFGLVIATGIAFYLAHLDARKNGPVSIVGEKYILLSSIPFFVIGVATNALLNDLTIKEVLLLQEGESFTQIGPIVIGYGFLIYTFYVLLFSRRKRPENE